MKGKAEIKRLIRESRKEQNDVVAKGFKPSMFVEGYIKALEDVLDE